MIRKFSLITTVAALGIGAVLTLAACTSAPSAGSTPKPSSSSRSQAGGGTQRFGGAGGGTFGQIAAVQGQTLQVQSTSSQTAVTFSSSTAISTTVSVSLSSVQAGECVTASSAPASGSGSASSGGAVTTVAISSPVNGSCTAGFGRGSGGRPSSLPSARPSFRPSDRPSGRPSGGFGGGRFSPPTSGEVTTVSGSTITVDAFDVQTRKTAPKTITVSSATSYTQQQTGTAADLTVGQCVLARGKADDTGTVAADSIAVSAPASGGCSTGFGFGGPRPNGGTASQGGTTNG